jgi:hypothetical protein
MPSDLKQQDINEHNDPSVMRQWDEPDFSTKFEEFYKIVDGLKIGLLGTYRPNIGVSHPDSPLPLSHHLTISSTARNPLHGPSQAHRPRLPLPLQQPLSKIQGYRSEPRSQRILPRHKDSRLDLGIRNCHYIKLRSSHQGDLEQRCCSLVR